MVNYYFNDYVKYKTDVGAEIYLVNKSSIHKIINYDDYLLSSSLSRKKAHYLNLFRISDNEERSRSISGFTHNIEQRFDSIERVIQPIHNKKDILCKYRTALVDATGSYKLTASYGEYYIVVISKNRKRPFQPEKYGRFYIESIVLRSPQKIFSYDFYL